MEQLWLCELATKIVINDPSRILNVDETAWRLYPTHILTWAEKGAESVPLVVNGDVRQSITVLATITADYRKLPLMILASGKTERVERSQLGDIGANISGHSPSGWTTGDVFCQYLTWLRTVQYCDNEPLTLVLDLYKAHKTGEVLQLAHYLGIELKFIPAGMTDRLQPLDRYIFGALKACCRRLYDRFCNENPDVRITSEQAVKFLQEAWDKISTQLIKKAWSIYEPSDEQGWADADD
jgi:hypothetical protein